MNDAKLRHARFKIMRFALRTSIQEKADIRMGRRPSALRRVYNQCAVKVALLVVALITRRLRA